MRISSCCPTCWHSAKPLPAWPRPAIATCSAAAASWRRSSRTYLDRPEYLLDWCAYFTQKGDALRAEGLLNDAIQNLAEKQCFDLSTPAQQARYRAACRACADSYTALAAATGQRSMRLRAALLRIGLPAYQAFLKHKT